MKCDVGPIFGAEPTGGCIGSGSDVGWATDDVGENTLLEGGSDDPGPEFDLPSTGIVGGTNIFGAFSGNVEANISGAAMLVGIMLDGAEVKFCGGNLVGALFGGAMTLVGGANIADPGDGCCVNCAGGGILGMLAACRS